MMYGVGVVGQGEYGGGEGYVGMNVDVDEAASGGEEGKMAWTGMEGMGVGVM